MAAVLSQNEVETGLLRKGFTRSNTDHRYYILRINEKKEAATFLSHGKNQEIGAPLLGAMAKELGINTSEFIDLVRCPLSTEDYLARKKHRLADALKPVSADKVIKALGKFGFQPVRQKGSHLLN